MLIKANFACIHRSFQLNVFFYLYFFPEPLKWAVANFRREAKNLEELIRSSHLANDT